MTTPTEEWMELKHDIVEQWSRRFQLSDNVLPQLIEIEGRAAWITYVDALWHPCTPDKAVWAKVIFRDNGERWINRVAHPECNAS